jgi:hypothetical protein
LCRLAEGETDVDLCPEELGQKLGRAAVQSPRVSGMFIQQPCCCDRPEP